MQNSVLETNRLILRRFKTKDKGRVFELAKNENVAYPCGFLAHRSLDETRDVIVNILQKREHYAIVLKEQNLLIGVISLRFKEDSKLAFRNNEAEVGFWLGEEYWGFGFLKEAAQELFKYAFSKLNLDRIFASCSIDNVRSFKVLEKLGFRYIFSRFIYMPLVNENRLSYIFLLRR